MYMYTYTLVVSVIDLRPDRQRHSGARPGEEARLCSLVER